MFIYINGVSFVIQIQKPIIIREESPVVGIGVDEYICIFQIFRNVCTIIQHNGPVVKEGHSKSLYQHTITVGIQAP
jgi:hypothetical protein